MANSKISALPAASTPLAGTELVPVVQGGITEQVSVANLTAGRAVSMLSVTADTTTLVVDSTNHRVGIGTATPAQRLHVDSGGAVATRISRSGGIVANSCIEYYNGTQTWNIGVSGSNFFGINYNNAAIDTALFRVSTAGDVTVSSGNIIPSTAAKGINFTANTPAAGMTSQLLNWYEEGTWTPTDASGAGLSFTVSFAKYVRVGKQVTVNMFITFPATASVAQVVLGGLPFSVASSNYPAVTFASNSGVALSGYANATTTTISIGTAADYSVIVTNATMSGRNLLMSLTYLVN